MARRTQIFKLAPWTGGVNSSVDPGVLPPNDLEQADNVVFSTTGTRTKRDGFDYLDTALPAVTHRSSTGTTRTLVFAESISVDSPEDQLLVVGEPITISGCSVAAYNTSATVASITMTNVANDTITYTGTGSLEELSTAESDISITKNHSYIGVHDLWYYDQGSSNKQRFVVAVANFGRFFRFDDAGRRVEIVRDTVTSLPTVTHRSSTGDDRTLRFNATVDGSLEVGDEISVSGIVLTAPSSATRSSSGTTRTLKFSASVASALAVGDTITVTGAGNANYNTTIGLVATITTTSVPDDTITYTFSGAGSLSEGSTADTGITVTTEGEASYNTDLGIISAITTTSTTNDTITYTFDGARLITESPTADTATITRITARVATALVDTSLDTCDMRTFNNKLFITLSGNGNTPKYYNPQWETVVWRDVPGAPDANIMQEHLGRLWMDDKLDRDRLHFCTTFDETEWQGIGDSGAIQVAQGDNDPVGISAIFPPYKGRLIAGKSSSVYQILGEAPEEFAPVQMTDGFGAESHKAAVAVDMNDLFFMSKRGFHSVIATDTVGDFADAYLSRKIQPTFNDWSTVRRKYTQGVYLPFLNSIAWTITENDEDHATSLWLFNPSVNREQGGEWYRWPNLNPQSLARYRDDDQDRLMVGTNDGRIMLGQNHTYTDFAEDGIPFRIKTGTIYVDGDPQTLKAFKKVSLLFRPRGRFSFTAYFTVDNFPAQAMSFSQQTTGEILGETFVLGVSLLGADAKVAPITKDVYGHGRGFTLEIFQSSADAQVEIYGLMVEWEPMDIADEVV